jgi:hypothetical protein
MWLGQRAVWGLLVLVLERVDKMASTFNIPFEQSRSPQVIVAWMRFTYPNTWPPSLGVDASKAMEIDPPKLLDKKVTGVDIQCTKSSLLGSATVSLIDTDGEILRAMVPGDWIFIWMVNHSDQADEIRKVLESENGPSWSGATLIGASSGFKFAGKVSAVRENGAISADGKATRRATVLCHSFSEFNTSVYFRPYMTANSKDGYMWMSDFFGSAGFGVVQSGGPQRMISLLYNAFCGNGGSYHNVRKSNPKSTPNSVPRIPRPVSNLLGHKTANPKDTLPGVIVRDVTSTIFGIQAFTPSEDMATGLNPSNVSGRDTYGVYFPPDDTLQMPRHYNVGQELRGVFAQLLSPWQNTSIQGILETFLIPTVNEMYTGFKLGRDGLIRPTLVVRQIPFSTDDQSNKGMDGELKLDTPGQTLFRSLPRWKVTEENVVSWDIARNDAMRTNFVNALPNVALPGKYQVEKILAGYEALTDQQDIARNGLRAQVASLNVSDILSGGRSGLNELTKLIADRCMNGHLKLSGHVSVVGVQEPVATGDNFEFDGIVYHIEQLAHSFSISASGSISFKTTFGLTNGVPTNLQDRFVGTKDSNPDDIENSVKVNLPQSSEVI